MSTRNQQCVKPRVKLLLVFFAFISSLLPISSQNFKEVKYAEALQLVEKTKEPNKAPVIAIIDSPMQLSLFDESFIWKNKNEIEGNGIDDDLNGYTDDVLGWNFSEHSNDITNRNLGNWHGTPVFSLIKNFLVDKRQNSRLVKLMGLVKGNSVVQIKESLAYVLQMRRRYNETNGKEGAFIVAVNCSWGKDGFWNYENEDWCNYYDALGKEGVLVISSVPNEDIDVDVEGDMPSTCQSDFLITVTNTIKNSSQLEYAAYGEQSVDIGAPGERSFTLLNSGDFGFFDGTSAAAPYVTSTIGLMYQMFFENFDLDIQQNPEKTALLIKDFILQGSDKLDYLQYKTTSGGSLNMYRSLKLLFDYYNNENKSDEFSLGLVSLYPNPSSNYMNTLIESSVSEEATLNIFDVSGRKVGVEKFNLTAGIHSYEFNDVITKLSSNIYMITVQTESGRFSEKTKFVKK